MCGKLVAAQGDLAIRQSQLSPSGLSISELHEGAHRDIILIALWRSDDSVIGDHRVADIRAIDSRHVAPGAVLLFPVVVVCHRGMAADAFGAIVSRSLRIARLHVGVVAREARPPLRLAPNP